MINWTADDDKRLAILREYKGTTMKLKLVKPDDTNVQLTFDVIDSDRANLFLNELLNDPEVQSKVGIKVKEIGHPYSHVVNESLQHIERIKYLLTIIE